MRYHTHSEDEYAFRNATAEQALIGLEDDLVEDGIDLDPVVIAQWPGQQGTAQVVLTNPPDSGRLTPAEQINVTAQALRHVRGSLPERVMYIAPMIVENDDLTLVPSIMVIFVDQDKEWADITGYVVADGKVRWDEHSYHTDSLIEAEPVLEAELTQALHSLIDQS